MRKAKPLLASMIAVLVLLAIIAPLAGCGTGYGVKPVVGASGEGVSVTCAAQDLPPGASLSATRWDEAQATQAAPLPADRIFMAAADFGPDGAEVPGAVLTFALDHQLESGWHLVVYAIQGDAWLQAGRAEVSQDGHTVSLQVAHLGIYALFLDENWRSVMSGNQELATRINCIPASGLGEEDVLAAGKVDDPAVLAAVVQETGYSDAEARSLLKSWDTTGDKVVRVMRLRSDVYVTRYTSANPADQLGRWFMPSETDTVLEPGEARAELALPLSNPAVDCALYRVKAGSVVIYGICANMSNQPGFGPDSVGGGPQIYVYKATSKIGARIVVNADTMEMISELRFVEGGE